jgi:large subunit ribosomal protein L7/L12
MAITAEKMNEIIDQLSELTIMEVSQLVSALEEKWGVSAAAPVAMAAAAPADGGAAAAAEKDEFNVVLKSAGEKKIQVIKDLVDSAPKAVKEGVAKDEAEEMKTKIEEAGGTVELE